VIKPITRPPGRVNVPRRVARSGSGVCIAPGAEPADHSLSHRPTPLAAADRFCYNGVSGPITHPTGWEASMIPRALMRVLVPLFSLVASVLSMSPSVSVARIGQDEAGEPPRFDAVNPAAAYCAALGYRYEIVEGPDGERGVCVLPDGRRVDAWDFFRGKCGQEYSYCARLGCATVARQERIGSFVSECAVCLTESGEELGTAAELAGIAEAGSRVETHPRHGRPVQAGWATHDCLEKPLPPAFDWRDLDGCTSIRNQGQCGSCWAFGSTAPLECNILIKDGVERDLSEQWLVSCNRDYWSCSGGGFAHNYYQWKTDRCGGVGAVLETDFPYWASNVPCDCPYPHHYLIDNWGHIGRDYDNVPLDAIKAAILEYGPVTVGVGVDGLFHSYAGGVFDACGYDMINHLVALVGWDDTQGQEGVWILRNSWGPGWGENGYMRIAYGCNAVGYGASWVDYREPIRLSLPNGAPDTFEPGVPVEITVRIEEPADTYVPGSGKLHYRSGDSGDLVSDFTHLGGDLYRAALPAPACGDRPRFFFTAKGERCGRVEHPSVPGSKAYRGVVGTATTLFADDFETDTGWTVESDAGLEDGGWNRGVPVGGGDRGDPPSDADGSGSCYLTDNADGNSDVDGGWARLVSPALDLSDFGEARVRFALWYTNNHGDNPQMDVLRVSVSSDGGSAWALVDSIGPLTPMPMDWHEESFVVGDHVPLTDDVRVRFEVADLWGGSLVEAGVDAFRVEGIDCDSAGRHEDGETGPGLALRPNAPNPFGPRTLITYELPSRARVSLIVYDAAGRVVRTLLNREPRDGGEHTASWDGRDDRGRRVASGAYFYRLEVGEEVVVRRMVLLK
jgi:putative hemolysin